MTEASAAEFARFVQEAKEQRARADALAVALAQHREALEREMRFNTLNQHIECCTEPECDPVDDPDPRCVRAFMAANMPPLAADQPAAGAELLAAADQLADAVEQWLDDPAVDATQEETDLLGEAYGTWTNCRYRAGHSAGEGPGREGE